MTFDPQPNGKPILCLDFDGCIHSYESGWQGADVIPDAPVPGVVPWIIRAVTFFDVHIYSSRSASVAGRTAMENYMKGICPPMIVDQLVFTSEKPRAFISIDDRCVRFEGDWGNPELAPEMLRSFVPWNKREKCG